MTVILIIIAILFLVLIRWTWHNLGNIENKVKIPIIIGGIIILYGITFLIYNISKIGIQYESKEVMKSIQSIFVLLFTIVNGYILLPYIFKMIEQIYNKEINDEKIKKKIIIACIVFIVIVIFEYKYLGNSQLGILKVMENLKK